MSIRVNLAALAVLLLLVAVTATEPSAIDTLEEELRLLENERGYYDEDEDDVSVEANSDEPTYPHMLLGDASFEADKELMDAVREIGSITRVPIPVYRDDLPSDYVAYWSVELNNDQYVVITSGPATGDYRLPIQGPLPSMISVVNLTAASYGKVCDRFYMMTPSGEMMCKDVDGHIVATSIEELLNSVEEDDDPMFEHAHNRLEGSSDILQLDWIRRAQQVKSDNVWANDGDVQSDNGSSFSEFVVAPGDVITLPVGGAAMSMKLRYIPEDAHAGSSVDEMQEKLCRVLSPCDADNPTDIDVSRATSTNGVRYIAVEVRSDCASVLGSAGVDFEIEVEGDNRETKRVYSLQCGEDATRSRQRRSTNSTTTVYRKWSRWWSRSIPVGDGLFPEYREHRAVSMGWKMERRTVRVTVNIGWTNHIEIRQRNYNVSAPTHNCSVGSGPVAWAMAFGYLDRRAHAMPETYGNGSWGLFRCGDAGTAGEDSCVAPATCDYSTRITKYIEEIAKAMDALCKESNGSTPAENMRKTKEFFQARQTSGRPRVIAASRKWRTNNRLFTRMRRFAITSIRRKWPVVVGTQEGAAMRHHYAVATAYRIRVRRYRVCNIVDWVKSCPKKWSIQRELQFYTHEGAGGVGNRWRPFDFRYVAFPMY